MRDPKEIMADQVGKLGLDIVEDSLTEDLKAGPRLEHCESLFVVGDGLIGVRGFLEGSFDIADAAGAAALPPYVFMNGVYEEMPIRYHEAAPGFAHVSDTRIPVADAFGFDISVGGVRLSADAPANAHTRTLNTATGTLSRTLVWLDAATGAKLEAVFTRSALLGEAGYAETEVKLTCLEGSAGSVAITSTLFDPIGYYVKPAQEQAHTSGEDEIYDPRIGPEFETCPWEKEAELVKGADAALTHRTKTSGFGVTVLARHALEGDWAGLESESFAYGLRCRVSGGLKAGESVTFKKAIAHAADFGDKTVDTQAKAQAMLAAAKGAVGSADQAALDNFLADSRVRFTGNSRLEGAINFNLYQLFQAVGRGGDLSIGAKGQTGEGYEGHVFWDAETYCLPAFALTAPELARGMLTYRHARIGAARQIARNMGHKTGALFPWRSIGGQECSAYFPAGTAQYHINSDIALAVRAYMYASHDWAFLSDHGFEILLETARVWLEIGYHAPALGGAFVIDKVTGPDEYTALVDNNLYTNVSAKMHMLYVLEALAELEARLPEAAASLRTRLGVSDAELAAFQKAAEMMYVPTSSDGQLYAQDDSFLKHDVWDFAGTPAENYPLLLHYHPLTIYRYQVCKQADAVLAFAVYPDEFDSARVARSYDYYEKLTTHDSTLSPSIFSWMAARLGKSEKALDYLYKTALIDLYDLGANTDHGLHMAAMAGSWLAVVMGFAGLHVGKDTARIDPKWFTEMGDYSVTFRLQGARLKLSVREGDFTLSNEGGADACLSYAGTEMRLSAGESATRARTSV